MPKFFLIFLVNLTIMLTVMTFRAAIHAFLIVVCLSHNKKNPRPTVEGSFCVGTYLLSRAARRGTASSISLVWLRHDWQTPVGICFVFSVRSKWPEAYRDIKIHTNAKRTPDRSRGFFLCWHLLIVPGRFQPSIVSTSELNCRVRDGNGCTLTVISTNLFRVGP